MNAESTFVRFGDFTLRPDSGELYRGEARIRLQEKPLQVLLLLIERAGQLVTREDLRNRLWPADTFVDFDRNLNTAVKKLRMALEDSAEQPRYVETIPRRGYRFVATIRPAKVTVPKPGPGAEAIASQPHPMAVTQTRSLHIARWLAIAPVALTAILLGLLATSAGDARVAATTKRGTCPEPVKLAVMPFQHDGRGPQHELSVELNEEVPRNLIYARTGNVSVLSGRSVQRYLCSKKDFQQMGRELGVGYVMEGSVRRSAEGYRITAQLFETRSGSLIAAESIDVPAAEVRMAQSRVADLVASVVLRCITPAQRASL